MVLSVASFLGSVGTTAGALIVLEFAQFQKYEPVVVVWLAGAACADIIIAAALVLYLVGDVVNPSISYVKVATAEEQKNRISFHGRSHRSHH